MRRKKQFEIRLFGLIEIRYGKNFVGMGPSTKKQYKVWQLFEYLVLNMNRAVPLKELMEMLWSDEGVSDPYNSLKALIYKLRREIDSLGFIAGSEVIVSEGGAYCFNKDVPFTVDILEFEKKAEALDAPDLSDEERLDQLMEAIDCFKGNIYFDMRNESWGLSIQTHYGDLYEKVVEMAVEILEQQGEYQRIVDICKDAMLLQPYVEGYYYYIIHAYAAMENFRAASETYEKVKEFMKREYGTTPGAEFESVYREIMKQRPKKSLDIEDLSSDFVEHDVSHAAFLVEYGEFKQIYRLVARRSIRTRIPAYMSVFTLGAQKGVKVDEDEKKRHLEILSSCLYYGLRQGDAFACVTPHQFAVIFDDIEKLETVEKINCRINGMFNENKENQAFGVISKIATVVIGSKEKSNGKNNQ